MNVRDPDLFRLVQAWLKKAENDLNLSNLALDKAEPCPFDLVCYHAQQCAEKYLKAYLVARQIEFPYTHDLRLLTDIIEGNTPTGPFCREAGDLTEYASRVRYPYERQDPNRREAERALSIAREVKEAVLELLRQEGFEAPAPD